jgi:hypothetical protein
MDTKPKKSEETSVQEVSALPPDGAADEVSATMEQARQVLEASRSEIERAERLLRETAGDISTKLDSDGGDSSIGERGTAR